MKQIFIFIAMAATVAVQAGSAQTSAVLSDRAAARFLDEATWGPTSASIAQLQQIGIIAWLNAQFALNTSDLPDQPLLGSDGKPDRDLTPVQAVFFQNAVTGQDQLRQRVAFALSQMWVVSAVSTKVAYAFPPYWRLFRDNAFGNYRDIMKAVTLSPAMGNYLNMANNNKGNAAKGTSANENYARELMQLFTVGLTQLDLNGNPVLDSSNNPVPTYDQSVVTNTARALTGWTYPTAPNATAKTNNPQYYLGPMHAVEAEHDTTAKTIIGGATIPAGQTAEQDLEAVLDALMAQRSMAPFVSRQLIQHLVTSDPSPAYVQRVAGVFLDNGSGVRGDMRAVITAILTDAGSARRRRPQRGSECNLRPPAGAGPVPGESAARAECDARPGERDQSLRNGAGRGPVLSADGVQLFLADVCAGRAASPLRSSRFIRRRPPRTARTSSTPPCTARWTRAQRSIWRRSCPRAAI